MDVGDPAGGSRALVGLIDKYGEELVSDFLLFYGVDFLEVLRPGGSLSPRRAVALINNLPEDSAFVAARRGGEQFRGWGVEEYLLAGVIDAINQNTYAFVSANSKRKPAEPKPVVRPQAQKPKRTNLFAQMAAAQYRAANKQEESHGGG